MTSQKFPPWGLKGEQGCGKPREWRDKGDGGGGQWAPCLEHVHGSMGSIRGNARSLPD